MRRTQDHHFADSEKGSQDARDRHIVDPEVSAFLTTGSHRADPLEGLSTVWSRITGLMVERGDGARLYDGAGRGYLDFTSGIGVTNTGHCHPRVVAAIRKQAGQLLHSQANIAFSLPHLELVRWLREVVPPGIDAFFFANSGAEAVEAALKLARQAAPAPEHRRLPGGLPRPHGRRHEPDHG